MSAPLLQTHQLGKVFGRVIALQDITMELRAGEVLGLLGDNGAGKSTLIKCLSGVHRPSQGRIFIEGNEVLFASPREALKMGIATVYQDLAMVPHLGISRNFVLGNEPTRGWGVLRRLDMAKADRITRAGCSRLGIDLRTTSQPVGTLSGGERQSVAIARAIHFGARILILDEPTSALGVKESANVLRDVAEARDRGVGVILITHNVYHAFEIADRYTILHRGRSYGNFMRDEVTRDEVINMMSGRMTNTAEQQ